MQLAGEDPLITHSISEDQLDGISDDFDITKSLPKDYDAWASIHLVDSGQILPLADRAEFTLGRVSEAQPIMPDIDLTPYQAYASGVSRLHAVIRREREQIYVMDLGSSNGTYLNGTRLKPNAAHELHHGDLISLGKLKIQVLLENPS
jgi:hypothetical protein